MASPIVLDSSCRITLRGGAYKNPCPTTAGYLLINARTGTQTEVSHEHLKRAHAEGALQIRRGFDQKPPVASASRSRPTKQERGKKALELQLHRLIYVRRFLELEAAGETSRREHDMKSAIEKIDAECDGRKSRADSKKTGFEPPTPRHLRRWLKAYATGGTNALQSQRHHMGNRAARFAPQTLQIMNRHLAEYAAEIRPTIQECYNAMVGEIEALRAQGVHLQCPSLKSFSRRLREEHQFRVHAKRHGTDAAVAKFYGAKGGVSATKPLERAEIDDFQQDLFVNVSDPQILASLSPKHMEEIQRIRHWMTVVIDAATRYVLAIIITKTPSADSALRAVRMAMGDKSDLAEAFGCLSRWEGGGRVCELVADNGANFTSAGFVGACTALGITVTHTIAGRPQFRGIVERFSRTLSYESVARFSGRTFSNPIERGDYPSEQRATLTADELAEAIVRALVDIYHNSPHRGLKGETPANAWKRLTQEFGAPPPPSRVEMIVAFGAEHVRKTGIQGIVCNGIQYHSKRLQEHRLHWGDIHVTIRVDHECLSEIAAHLDGVWVEIPAVDQKAAAVSLDQLKTENAYIAMKFSGQARESASVVRETRRYLREKSLATQRRAGLIAPDADERALRRAEAELVNPFEIAADTVLAEAESALGGEFPVSGSKAFTPDATLQQDDPRYGRLLEPRNELSGWSVKE